MPTIAQLEAVLKTEPDDAFLLYGLAQAHAKEGEHETAISYYDRCLEQDATTCYAHYHKARSLESIGKIADARAELELCAQVGDQVGDAKAASEALEYLAALEA